MSAPNLTEVRARAWQTRRTKYGPKGHNSSFTRSAVPCARCRSMEALIVRLHNEGILTEGQAAKATGLYRIELRALADKQGDSQ